MHKVLIAEDDKFLSNAYRVAFSHQDFDVQMAGNGEEVFTILKEFRPDVILLDLIMPVKDGFTTLKELKQSPDYKDIPVVVASNLGQAEDFEKATALGCEGYVIKSDVDIDDIIQKVISYISSDSSAGEISAER